VEFASNEYLEKESQGRSEELHKEKGYNKTSNAGKWVGGQEKKRSRTKI